MWTTDPTSKTQNSTYCTKHSMHKSNAFRVISLSVCCLVYEVRKKCVVQNGMNSTLKHKNTHTRKCKEILVLKYTKTHGSFTSGQMSTEANNSNKQSRHFECLQAPKGRI